MKKKIKYSACNKCIFLKKDFCTKFKFKPTSAFLYKTCREYSPSKDSKEVFTKKNVKGICRFIDFEIIDIIYLGNRWVKTGKIFKEHGLQIETKIFLDDNRYKFITSKYIKITKIYEDIPSWANEEQIKKYNIFLNN